MNIRRYKNEALKVAKNMGIAFDGITVFVRDEYVNVTFYRWEGPLEKDEDGYEILSKAPKLYEHSVQVPIETKFKDFGKELQQNIEEADIVLTLEML